MPIGVQATVIRDDAIVSRPHSASQP